jgi:hypothetical protein
MISGDDTLASYQDLVVNGEIEITEGDTTDQISIVFTEEDGDVGIPPTDEWTLDWEVDDESVAEVIASDSEKMLYQLRIYGKVTADTEIKIMINHLGHKDYESAGIPVIVSSSD